MAINEHELERTIRTLASASDERLGQIVGLAAILCCLPEVAAVDRLQVNAVIDQTARQIFGGHAIRDSAHKFVTAVLQAAAQREQAAGPGSQG